MTADQAAARQAAHENVVGEMASVLRAARAQITEDREALLVGHRSFATGRIEDGPARKALARYDALLAKIDSVITKAGGAA